MKEPCIKRLVFTSSFAAVFDPSRGSPGFTFISSDWNPQTYDDGKNTDFLTGYRASKKLAEEALWDHFRDEKPHFDLVTICPPMVFGPVVHPVSKVEELNASNAYIWAVAAGANPLPATRVLGWVDVRDVAVAHVEALLQPEVGNQRFLVVSPEKYSYQLEADILRSEFEWAKQIVAKGEEGAPLPMSYDIDGETAAKAFGIKYRSFKDCILEAVPQFKEIQRRETA